MDVVAWFNRLPSWQRMIVAILFVSFVVGLVALGPWLEKRSDDVERRRDPLFAGARIADVNLSQNRTVVFKANAGDEITVALRYHGIYSHFNQNGSIVRFVLTAPDGTVTREELYVSAGARRDSVTYNMDSFSYDAAMPGEYRVQLKESWGDEILDTMSIYLG